VQKAEWDKLIDNLEKQGILRSPKIALAMRMVPRSKFLPPELESYSARDAPLSIGFGQTVSAPHMVSIMDEALQLAVGHKVLEVGAGCGWHAATIAELVTSKDEPRSEWGHVYTTEIIPALAEQAKKNIRNTGYGDRVTIINTDGSQGYPEKAPYNRIVVTAAAPEVPQPLLDQLKVGGLMVIPVGRAELFQNLLRISKEPDGKLKRENLGGVAFVPLTGEYGVKTLKV
jgi:protein-L-isoaspartate(D-aspartate) O-methyltransferase